MCCQNEKNAMIRVITRLLVTCLFDLSLDYETLNLVLSQVLKKYVEYFFRLCIFFFFCLKLLLNLWTPVPHPSLITWSVFYQSVKLHVVILFEVLPVRQRSYCWHTHLHCVSLLLWQMSCSVAIFNWQICQLCINLCKLPRPYLVPEMAPGLRFHPMAQPVGHAGEMTRNWRQLRVVTPWHTLNKQLWALYY